ncbi:MAG: tRNA uridine-5-carboxymethylaminomethyl(34) synthesis GTPase MnmE, partial [Microcoleaceae cyanobacterium]
ESIADLVGAKSQLAAETALAGMQGKLATPIKKLRNQALDILAEIEARIDFEEDLPPLDQPKITTDISNMLQELEVILATAEQGELLRTGLKVAIVGRPNVGKSSLLNAWSKTDRAIVTELPGTTRDVVESQLVVRGIPVQVLDTAGIRETVDLVEKIGVERSRLAAESADLVLFTIDATTGWTADDQIIFDEISQRPVILIINKIDLVTAEQVGAIASNISSIKHSEKISQVVKTAVAINQGIHELEEAIMNIIHNENLQAANMDVAINQRQASALTQAHNALSQCLQTIQDAMPLDFWTIDLRGAIQALGEVTGEEVTESVLDRVFSRFCIGK